VIGRDVRGGDGLDAGAPVDDVDLVRLAQADPKAFAELYDRYVDPIYRYCYRRLGDVAAAEDATSTTFFKALNGLARLNPQAGSFRSWLFAIAHNVVLDQVRLRQRRPEAPIDLIAERPGTEMEPAEQVVQLDERRRLRRAVAMLSDEQQQIIELRLAGLNGPEIAAALGRSAGSVRTAQHRAIQRLRSLLSPDREATPRGERKETTHG
jgi:RNA polymerase sigma-70 factor (ECF subfamily)